MGKPLNTINTRLDSAQRRYRIDLGIIHKPFYYYVYADDRLDALHKVLTHVAKLKHWPAHYFKGISLIDMSRLEIRKM